MKGKVFNLKRIIWNFKEIDNIFRHDYKNLNILILDRSVIVKINKFKILILLKNKSNTN